MIRPHKMTVLLLSTSPAQAATRMSDLPMYFLLPQLVMVLIQGMVRGVPLC